MCFKLRHTSVRARHRYARSCHLLPQPRVCSWGDIEKRDWNKTSFQYNKLIMLHLTNQGSKFQLQTRTDWIDISHLFSCNTDKTVHLQKLQTWNPFCKCNGSNNCGRFQNVNIHLIIRNHCILISVWWPQDYLCIYKTLLHTAHLICKKNIYF